MIRPIHSVAATKAVTARELSRPRNGVKIINSPTLNKSGFPARPTDAIRMYERRQKNGERASNEHPIAFRQQFHGGPALQRTPPAHGAAPARRSLQGGSRPPSEPDPEHGGSDRPGARATRDGDQRRPPHGAARPARHAAAA